MATLHFYLNESLAAWCLGDRRQTSPFFVDTFLLIWPEWDGGGAVVFVVTVVLLRLYGVCACTPFAAPNGTGQLCNCKLSSGPNTFGSAWTEIGILSVFHGCLFAVHFCLPITECWWTIRRKGAMVKTKGTGLSPATIAGWEKSNTLTSCSPCRVCERKLSYEVKA